MTAKGTLTPAQIDVRDLPHSLQRIVEAIGLKSTLALVSHHGGIRVYVPKTIKPGHRLTRQIGLQGARALAACFPGELLFVPRAAGALRMLRNAEIREQHAAGHSAAKLARRFGLTERQVFTILGKHEPTETPQPSLF